MPKEIKSKKANEIIAEIIDQYTFSGDLGRPWVIGFSGGKDSTVLLTLVWIALQKVKDELPEPFQLMRPVHVVCNDTMVENPIIAAYVEDVLVMIEKEARAQGLPFFVKKTTPKLEESFWINVIGKGYPVPNNTFRWCTDRLKIKPTSNFLMDQIDENGEAIVLLGTRYDESTTRARSMRKHEVNGSRLSKHTSNPNAFVYAPIAELVTEEVWFLINTVPSPWGFDNSILFKLYLDASADDYECPTVVTTKEHKSCGQSRFGCWTCTVVSEDKSMSAQVTNGESWMEPLLKFRKELVDGRNIPENRSRFRRNGMISEDEEGNPLGTMNTHFKTKTLKNLLQIQKEVQAERPHITLITNQELIAIQVFWRRDMFFDKSVSEIYQEVYGKELNTNNIKSLDHTEKRLLKEVCEDSPEYYNLIDNLISLQESKTLMISRLGLHNDLEKRIEEFVNPAKS